MCVCVCVCVWNMKYSGGIVRLDLLLFGDNMLTPWPIASPLNNRLPR